MHSVWDFTHVLCSNLKLVSTTLILQHQMTKQKLKLQERGKERGECSTVKKCVDSIYFVNFGGLGVCISKIGLRRGGLQGPRAKGHMKFLNGHFQIRNPGGYTQGLCSCSHSCPSRSHTPFVGFRPRAHEAAGQADKSPISPGQAAGTC